MVDIAGRSLPKPTDDKPVIVRVKRKAFQSHLDAFWLEINERPVKRPLLDFEKLSISDSSSAKESNSAYVLGSKTKIHERRYTFKKENKHDQLLSKARQEQEVLAKNARFEQIWRSRKGNQEAVLDKSLHEMCRFYDVVRVEAEEKSNELQQPEDMSLEDQRLLCSYLPVLRDLIPSAAAEIESDISSRMSEQASRDDYVYDVYTVKDDANMNDEDALNPFPLVQVDDDEDFYDGPDDSEYESDAENNPLNDYPDEISEEEDEVKGKSSDDKSEDDETDSSRSSESDDLVDGDPLYEDDEIDDIDEYENNDAGSYDRDFDFSDVQEWRRAYR